MNHGAPVRITGGPYWLQIGDLGVVTGTHRDCLIVTLLHGGRRRLCLLPGEVEAW